MKKSGHLQKTNKLTNFNGDVLGNVNIYVQGSVSENGHSEMNEATLKNSKDNETLDDSLIQSHHKNFNSFDAYVSKAVEAWSMKKTLLYEQQPHSFYELYVCNNLSYYKSRFPEYQIEREDNGSGVKEIIKNATPELLEKESKYIIIEGTGGMGKSMFLTHIFLSSAKEYSQTGKLPVFMTLKDYKDKTHGIIDFIWKTVKSFMPKITKQSIISILENRKALLLLDGLDEIQSSLREKFNTDLDNFIKAYPGNSVIMTSRINSFVSFTRFSVFDIEPLTKDQAIQLISKLNYWNEQAKSDFLRVLENNLYYTHTEFASNPLLLTIMLMTYTTFGEVPGKMHIFYAKAYETMARLHDATKGSYQRPFNTGLTPEELAKFFAEFCAATYENEESEFTKREFILRMDKVLDGTDAQAAGVTSQDFLLDLTNNLCIMYREGEKYYFIHRTFQEYFTAFYLAYYYFDNFEDVGDFFEESDISFTDRTFDMLYDMVTEKVERYIFLPYLEKLISDCDNHSVDKMEGYWEFLSKQYPTLHYNSFSYDYAAYACSYYSNEPKSFLYRKIINGKKLTTEHDFDALSWPEQVTDFDRISWVSVCTKRYGVSDSDDSDITEYYDEEIVEEDEVPIEYSEEFWDPETVGYTYFIDIDNIRESPKMYVEIKEFMESPQFPLMQEYNNVNKYYRELKSRIQKQKKSKGLVRK